MATQADQKSVTAGKDEQPALDALDALLSALTKHAEPAFLDVLGKEIALPESVVELLRQGVHQLAHSQAVTLVPAFRDLTTQQAADILNMSRPYLINLLERGEIPFTRTGAHRRIHLDDVMRYKAKRDTARRQALDELTRLNQEMGLYDK